MDKDENEISPIKNVSKVTSFTEEQMLLARSKSWTPELEKLLRKWNKNIIKREKEHRLNASRSEKLHYVIGAPSAILSAIASVGIFSTFENCDPNTVCDTDQWIRLTSGIIAVFSTGFTAFHLYMNYEKLAQQHKKTSDELGSLSRYIESLTMTHIESLRGDPVAVLQRIRKEYDNIVKRAPILSSKYENELSYTVINSITNPPTFNEVPEISSKSPITIPPNELKLLDNLASLTPVLQSERIDSFVHDQNDYDTSDEGREVCITFDLDSMRSPVSVPSLKSSTIGNND